jgi:hypothetical protein
MTFPRSYAASALALLLAAALASTARAPASAWPPDPYPAPKRVAEAREIAAEEGVSFAVLDADGGVRGYSTDTQYSSASVSKALLLAAELRQLREDKEELDDGTRSLLEPMIRYSDNDAASSVYALVGDGGMEDVAARAGMRSFEVTPGYWGGAQVTAGDLSRFFYRLDRNLRGRYHDYAKNLLATITETQRWGIPDGAGQEWRVWFKGGWRPAATEETSGPVTHQAALLRHRSGREVAIAVLSNRSPGTDSYAVISGITNRLLAKPPAPARWPAG